MPESTTVQDSGLANAPAFSQFEQATYAKVTRRLLPFLLLCYVVSYLDRINIGFAKLQMLSDLRFSETVFGLGAGIFFIGYFLFEVPSNIIMYKVGTRVWIARIMVTWGIVSACTLLVKTPAQFYGVRFLLGVAEAGFFPGIILYLTYWYPAHRRARMVATFMVAIPLSGILGGPISGFIMQFLAGKSGLPGWKWLFLLEAIPSVLLGLATLVYLDSGIRQAKWLTEEEKQLLERNIARERAEKIEHPSLLAVFRDRRVWLMSWIFFSCAMGQYALTFWMPSLIRTAGVKSVLNVGLLTAVPYVVTAAAMVLLGASADRHRERRWHLAAPMIIGAVALVLSVWAGKHAGMAIVFLSIAAAGVISSAPLFWSLPTAFLSGAAAAAGIATINSIGNLAGFVSPYMIGGLEDLTHSDRAAMYCLLLILVAGAATVFKVPAKMVNH
ncbi:MAG TPA: MFS transporter [Candidatus Acidoferrales bacterium]|nr:MFS transporter [Candidatus Acidoferrales bacterium]